MDLPRHSRRRRKRDANPDQVRSLLLSAVAARHPGRSAGIWLYQNLTGAEKQIVQAHSPARRTAKNRCGNGTGRGDKTIRRLHRRDGRARRQGGQVEAKLSELERLERQIRELDQRRRANGGESNCPWTGAGRGRYVHFERRAGRSA